MCPAYWVANEDPKFHNIAGLFIFPVGLPVRLSKAGQLLIFKQTHLAALLLAAYYEYGLGIYYPIPSQGAAGEVEKETFFAAAVVLRKPTCGVRCLLGTVGYHEADRKFHGTAMVHPTDDLASRDSTSLKQVRPLFMHANSPKINMAHLIVVDKCSKKAPKIEYGCGVPRRL